MLRRSHACLSVHSYDCRLHPSSKYGESKAGWLKFQIWNVDNCFQREEVAKEAKKVEDKKEADVNGQDLLRLVHDLKASIEKQEKNIELLKQVLESSTEQKEADKMNLRILKRKLAM